MTICIIGGGASGMAAALAAAKNPGNQVILFERQSRLGKKLQATGNGRCNLTNIHSGTTGYHGEDPAFAEHAIHAFDSQMTLKWFRELGLLTVTEETGRVYPYSDQANSVVDVLRFALERSNIQVITGTEITKVRNLNGTFRVESAENSWGCDRLIIACGGLAGTKLGGSMSGYKLLGKLGHRMTRLRPALVQLKSDWDGLPGLKGVRANCDAKLLCDGLVVAQSTGEIQFTQYGLSGPVIFEISRDACSRPGSWQCALDLLPPVTEEELFEELRSRRTRGLPVDELLTGILHNRLGRVLTKAAGVRNGQSPETLSDFDLKAVCGKVKSMVVEITEPMGMDCAQVTAGGIRTADFDPNTMESRIVPGLYACGEVLDIDGDCGGFNLQWAWSSGYAAGSSAGGETE